MIIRRCLFQSLLVGLLAAVGTGCATVPNTGRKQLILISTQQELSLGAQAYKETLQKEKLSQDDRMTDVLRRVGKRIAAVAGRDDFQWEFALIESPMRNAFCLPGGKIAVYTGILPYMKNEAGMAAVLGHEVAHAIARHGAERMSQGMVSGVIEQAVANEYKKASPAKRKRVMSAFGLGANIGVLLPFSRTHELEADQIGLLFVARAGYDPREAVRFWERMNTKGKKTKPELLSTHPHSDHRIEKLQQQMSAAMDVYRTTDPHYGLGESW